MTDSIPTPEQVKAMPTDELLERLELLISELDARTKGVGAEIAMYHRQTAESQDEI